MASYNLFQRYGVELEYMIVDAKTLDVRPIADKLLSQQGSTRKNEIKHGKLRWSNELVLHVIELKTDGPAKTLDGLAEDFQEEVGYLNKVLGEQGCRLLPSGMHPWMDPHTETKLWPHGNKEIYQTFDKIFDCRGHGWSNLQSTHINLPFTGDDEFYSLHSAIRLLLPLLPALAASSPFIDGRLAPNLDMRLETYRHNCDRIPSVTGKVVPERVRSEAEYQREILEKIYADIAPLDPEGILRDEWVNARGAIARFTRGTIEIRVLDIQECPKADLAVVQFIACILKALTFEGLASTRKQGEVTMADLQRVFLSCVEKGGHGVVDSVPMLRALGIAGNLKMRADDVLAALLERCASPGAPWRPIITSILQRGTLAARLRQAAGPEPDRRRLHAVYEELANSLASGRLFRAGD